MNVVQCLSHSIEAYDQLRLYAHMGVDAFDVGGYIDPRNPHDDKRPAVPEMPFFPELKAAVDAIGADDNLRVAQERLPDALLDWADVIVFHHYLDRLWGQWDRIERWLAGGSHRRVIWRTVGQSVDGNEWAAQPYRNRGLQIVRYSPKEWAIPNFAGSDALIRFYKDPAEWYGWTGERETVIQVTQNLRQREPYTNWGFWDKATQDIPRMPLGPGSEAIGGPGSLTYTEMQVWLRSARVMLYTGTQPASYTLGLIEAMMTGVPVVSIPPDWMGIFPYGKDLFEGHELATHGSVTLAHARQLLGNYVNHDHAVRSCPHPGICDAVAPKLWENARRDSALTRAKAIELFGKEKIASEWAAFLGVRVPVAA